jgi:anti-sigma factor RsiW
MKDASTHAWLRRVSDYHSGGVSATERAAVEAHLAECVECQQALAVYRRFSTLARSPLRLGDGGTGALTEYRLFTQEKFMSTMRNPN